ncbi:MAG: pentapeptide repeat-containing protein [Hydrogenophaga sp.]|nr:pentapeptide repeat-containing protein [Hydrogenophaga sp.]
MQIDSQTYIAKLVAPSNWEECVYRYCTFERFNEDGLHVTSAFLDCRFESCDLYWALFNTAVLVGVGFKNCVFRGCSFSGCCFVECRFDGCSFENDNLGGPCRFDETRWYGCAQSQSQGLDHVWVPPLAIDEPIDLRR